ncbi:hypothetical protein C882_1926 [Caenispirillum salinarum AK4]|uniref:Uncharacterized protein n=1 Tax=Caenispirillum salinarum AK4 TaxID=1238182 RepID=K9GPE1_9PROT|nr:hypothetical protein [Caenispirillum salinarum]EKV26997.1 hypothetical protein C882_1926 [Caenispirillum salinarum AK4]
MSEPKAKDGYILLDRKLSKSFMTAASVPTNLETRYGGAGGARGIFAIVPFIGILGPLGIALEGAITWSTINNPQTIRDLKKAKDEINHIDFKEAHDRQVGQNVSFEVVALQRDPDTVDLVVKAHANYVTAFKNSVDDPAAMRSLFRDKAVFALGGDALRKQGHALPHTTMVMDPSSLAPPTVLNEVTYQYSNTWSLDAGFSGSIGGGSGGDGAITGGYSFTTSASTTRSDFGMTRTSRGPLASMWSADLQNVYEGHHAFPYNTAKLESVIGHSIFANWVRSVPAAAEGDLDLEYLAAVTVRGPLPKTIRVPFALNQRLIHAEVDGRWGAPGARVGGMPIVLPNTVETNGFLVVDTESWTVSVEDTETSFMNTKQILAKLLEKADA